MPHVIRSSNWPCAVDFNSSDEVTSTNSAQHSASSERAFLSHSFRLAYYFQFPTIFWTKFKRDKLPDFARYKSLLLKTNRFEILSSQTYVKTSDINFISKHVYICICIPSGEQIHGKEAHLRFLGYQVVSLPLSLYKF